MDTSALAAFGIVVLGIAALFALAFLPGWVAYRRGCDRARDIRVLGVAGLLLGPLWLVAMVWALVGKVTPGQQRLPKQSNLPKVRATSTPYPS